MAVASLCAKLIGGQDAVCVPPKRKYFQQAVVINKSDIDTYEIATTDYNLPSPVCAYTVEFTLKEGKTGYRFQGPENGASYFGTYDKSRSDLGFTQYIHNANILVVGANAAAKCILDSLDKGSFVVAFQFTDGTVEIYGIENGLSTGDYTYDVQGGGGGTAIILSSIDTAPENYLPLVYKSAVPGSETEDFDAAFANTGS
jgi:hypothetical protein